MTCHAEQPDPDFAESVQMATRLVGGGGTFKASLRTSGFWMKTPSLKSARHQCPYIPIKTTRVTHYYTR